MIVAGIPTVENETLPLADIVFGGSSVSRSVTAPAITVTVHVSSRWKSVAGSSVNVRGPPVCVALCAPLRVHEIEYQSPLAATSSLKVIATFESTATFPELLAGSDEAIRGAGSPPLVWEPRPPNVSVAKPSH